MHNRPSPITSNGSPPDELCVVVQEPGRTTVTVSSSTASLRPLRRILDDALAADLDEERRSEILVAVNEAATNAIQAHHRSRVEKPFTVTVDLTQRQVIVDDHGTPEGGDAPTAMEPVMSSDPDEGGPGLPLPDPSLHRGRGHHIIRTICPQSRMERTDDGFRILLPLD